MAALARSRRRLAVALAGLGLLGTASAGLLVAHSPKAAADASGPPPFSALTNCPTQQYPPAGYTGGYVDHQVPANVQANLNKGNIGYLIPFRGTLGSNGDAGGQVVVPATDPTKPALIIPHLYGAVCGLISLPELTGVIFPTNVVLGTVNVYVGSQPSIKQAYPDAIEALPLALTFGTLTAGVVSQPAHNGGLDVTLSGSTSAAISLDGTPGAKPNALGTSCPLNLPKITFSTLQNGTINGVPVAGKPVTGPVMGGQAQVVSNTFPVPAVQPSPTCPAIVAQTVNKFFGLPLPAGRATFVAPFTFQFEINQ